MSMAGQESNQLDTISYDANNGTVYIDGFPLQYRIEGQGSPAIVIGSVNQYPQTFSQKLREKIKLIFVDHRAFVQAPKNLKNVTFELDTILDDIEKIRETLGLEQVIIVGHSGHSYMALEYAKKYPLNVSHVVMIAIAPSLSSENQEAAGFYWKDFASEERKAVHLAHLKQLPDESLKDLLPSQRYIKEYIRNGAKFWYDFNMDANFLWENVPINMTIFNHIWYEIFRDIDITKGLSNFDKPIFLALGLYDFAVAPFTAWYPIRTQFKQLTISLFEKSGHTPQFEESALFCKRLLKWLFENFSTECVE